MIIEAYWLVLLLCIVFIIRYLYFRLNSVSNEALLKKKLEMIGIIKWTGIISLGGFIILSLIAVIFVVFGNNFYEIFSYYDEDDMEYKSHFLTYRSMFFIGIIGLIAFISFGGKLEHIMNGKFIDDDLRNKS